MTAIVRTDDVLGGELRLDGRRISVIQAADLVFDGCSSTTVADQLALTLSEVHVAMASYYGHPEEIEAIRRANDDLEERLRERSSAPTTAER